MELRTCEYFCSCRKLPTFLYLPNRQEFRQVGFNSSVKITQGIGFTKLALGRVSGSADFVGVLQKRWWRQILLTVEPGWGRNSVAARPTRIAGGIGGVNCEKWLLTCLVACRRSPAVRAVLVVMAGVAVVVVGFGGITGGRAASPVVLVLVWVENFAVRRRRAVAVVRSARAVVTRVGGRGLGESRRFLRRVVHAVLQSALLICPDAGNLAIEYCCHSAGSGGWACRHCVSVRVYVCVRGEGGEGWG